MKRKRRTKSGVISPALILLLSSSKLHTAAEQVKNKHHTSNFHNNRVEASSATDGLKWNTKQANGQSYGGFEVSCDPTKHDCSNTEPLWLTMMEDILGLSSEMFKDTHEEMRFIRQENLPTDKEGLKKFIIEKFKKNNPEEYEKWQNTTSVAQNIFQKSSTSDFITEAPTTFKFGLNYGSTPEQIHFWHRMQQAYFLLSGKKKIGSKNKADIEDWQKFYRSIVNYGCYCYVGRPVTGGKGNAVDGLDEVCKALFRCERCLSIDSGNGIFGETGCDRHMGYTYRAKTDKGKDKSKKPYIFCHTNNNKCQMASCRCDKAWAQAVAELYEFWSEDNKFIADENGYCEKQERPDGSEKGSADRCCGYYPKREPYKSYSHRQCCGIQLYNSNSRECCDPKESKLAKTGQCKAKSEALGPPAAQYNSLN